MVGSDIKPSVCYDHLTFLKCVNSETICSPKDTFNCQKHQYLFDMMHEKLKQSISEPACKCSHECFFEFVADKMRRALVLNNDDQECQGECYYKCLHALMAADVNKTLVYDKPYVPIRNKVQTLTQQLLESENPLVCFHHLPFLKKVSQCVRTLQNQCKLHQYIFDETKAMLSKGCRATYSTCDDSCFFVDVLEIILEAEKKKRDMSCVCPSECFHNFLCDTVGDHVNGSLVYSSKIPLYSMHESEKCKQAEPEQFMPLPQPAPRPEPQPEPQPEPRPEPQPAPQPEFQLEHTHRVIQTNQPELVCRTPVCWDHLTFLKCMYFVTKDTNDKFCHCMNHSDLYERVKLQLAGRALPTANCSNMCFFNRLLEELMDSEQTLCPDKCFLKFTLKLMEVDAENSVEKIQCEWKEMLNMTRIR